MICPKYNVECNCTGCVETPDGLKCSMPDHQTISFPEPPHGNETWDIIFLKAFYEGNQTLGTYLKQNYYPPIKKQL